jgi:uncharacterized protein (TIGR02217 family)
MAFIESPRFPEGISYRSTGGPAWKTQVVQTSSGREQRTQTWQESLRRWDALNGTRSDADLDQLQAWFLVSAGMANGFRWKDWKDYSAVTANSSGIVNSTGLGTGTASGQLYKRYSVGSNTQVRKIAKPVAGTVKVYKNGVLVLAGTSSGQCSVNSTTGVVTFYGTAPTTSDSLTWTGEFDVPVRFDTDTFSASYDDLNASSVSLPVVEIRL